MKAYQIDSSWVYMGTMECQKHPFKDEWLRPTLSVLEAPPSDEPGKWRYVGVNAEYSWVEFSPPEPEKVAPTPVQEIIDRVRQRQRLNEDEFLELMNYLLDRLD